MAGRVLVEERVEERDVKLSHPRAPVDERDLSEPRGPLVQGKLRTDDVLSPIGPRLDDPPALEPELEPLDDHPAREPERPGGANGALGPPRVG